MGRNFVNHLHAHANRTFALFCLNPISIKEKNKSQRGYKTCLFWVCYWRLNLPSTTQAGGNVAMPEHPNLSRQIHPVQSHTSGWVRLSWLTWMMTAPECSKLYIAVPKSMSRSCCVQHRQDAALRQLHWGHQEFVCGHKAKMCAHFCVSEIPASL